MDDDVVLFSVRNKQREAHYLSVKDRQIWILPTCNTNADKMYDQRNAHLWQLVGQRSGEILF